MEETSWSWVPVHWGWKITSVVREIVEPSKAIMPFEGRVKGVQWWASVSVAIVRVQGSHSWRGARWTSGDIAVGVVGGGVGCS